ncbi:MAG: class II fructose-bisphosphate aldolase [Alphaproteobacteria bacterium]
MPAIAVRAVVIHDVVHARAALAAAEALDAPVLLLSATGFAGYGGALLFCAIVEEARAHHPKARAAAMLDCADSPGHALAALRTGLKAIRLGGRADARRRVADIARALGAHVAARRPAALDLLGVEDPVTASRIWLAPKAGKIASRRPNERPSRARS